MDKTTLIVGIVILIVLIIGVYYFMQSNQNTSADQQNQTNQQAGDTFDIKGMQFKILQQGTGEPAKSGDSITVNYVGTLQDGTKFDSSVDREQPFTFTLGQNSVIQGWELGVLGMKVGEKRQLTIPPELAYGENGAGGVIPPNATLIFEVDMLGINQ